MFPVENLPMNMDSYEQTVNCLPIKKNSLFWDSISLLMDIHCVIYNKVLPISSIFPAKLGWNFQTHSEFTNNTVHNFKRKRNELHAVQTKFVSHAKTNNE